MTSTQEPQFNAAARRAKGEFVRGISGFRSEIGVDPDFPAEAGRYHLFVALNCPWCHRVVAARNVLGLEKSISMDVAFPSRTTGEDGTKAGLWEFAPGRLASLNGEKLPECTAETGTSKSYRLAAEIYEAEGASETSLPILYDKKQKRIVNNESAEIIRMLNQFAQELGSNLAPEIRFNLYPDGFENEELRQEINRLNEVIYVAINNGAYKAGFSSDQKIYATAFAKYFETLAELNQILAADNRPFLTGQAFTEADLRLFPTLYRHDPVYFIRMKLNGARILDYPHLWRWLCRVHSLKGMRESCSLVHCRQGYFGRSWNNVIPLGPFSPMPYPEAYDHPELAK